MDSVAKLVAKAAAEEGKKFCAKAKIFIERQYDKYGREYDLEYDGSGEFEGECYAGAGEKVKGFIKKTGEKAEKTVSDARTGVSAAVARVKQKPPESAAEIIKKGLQKGHNAIESSRLYYQLGKLVYEQAVSRDHAAYTYPIVEKIHEISKVKGEEQKVGNAGWEDEETI